MHRKVIEGLGGLLAYVGQKWNIGSLNKLDFIFDKHCVTLFKLWQYGLRGPILNFCPLPQQDYPMCISPVF